MRRAKYILSLLFVVYTVSLTGQSKSELREMFVSAEGDILFEDYAEALPKYLNLLKMYPENFNLYFRIGQCYLNTPGEKDKSIPYLETAVQHINHAYRNGKFSENGAPYDALYFLANAYRINNELDQAIVTYEQFLKDIDTGKYDTSLVRFQIQTCYNAGDMMRKPVYVVERNLGNTINERFSEYNPVISEDEKTILFTRGLQFYDAIFRSTKVNGKWTEPVNLTPQLGVDQDYYTSSLSPDGRTLLLYRIDSYDGNIYQSRLEGDTWSKVEKLNGNINTKYWESHATMTRDGRKIFFTSNRRESMGGLDIFMSERDSTGDWGPAVNLGPVINTVYNEDTPFLANNDRTLFFSSRGHYNMGGYDIFRSDLDENGRWGAPVNIGYPMNTTDDDLFFVPTKNGYRGYYSKFSDDGYGKMDIYICDIYSDLNPRNFMVTGKAGINNLLDEFPQSVKVTAVNNLNNKKAATTLTDPVTDIYSLMLPQGDYTINYNSDKAAALNNRLNILPDHKGDTIQIKPLILDNTDFHAHLRLVSDTLISAFSKEPVNIDLIAEERSLLNIRVLSPDSVVSNEKHSITDSTFTFTFVPDRGESSVTFTLTDRFGNDTSAVVRVSCSGVPRQKLKPLYHKIPTRPKDEVVPVAPTPPAAESTITEETVTADNEGISDAQTGGCRWLWWLLVPAALILFFIIMRREKKEKEKENNDNDK